MRRATTLHLSVPMRERVRLCREDYAHFAADPRAMVAKLQSLKPLVGGEELALWQKLADEARVDELFERLMTQHYDPAYLRSTTREFGPGDAVNRLELESLQPAALAVTARTMIASRDTRTPDA